MTGFWDQGDDARRSSDSDAGNEGGGFAFDEATMRSIITKWIDLAESYDKSRITSYTMTRVVPPGNDMASQAHAAAASSSGANYVSYVQANSAYCLKQAQLFQDALDEYLGHEEATVIEINKTHPDGELPAV